MSQDYEKMAKIVVIGDTAVGKSNLLTRFCNDEFHNNSQPTIGTNFLSKSLKINDVNVKAQFWDTAGQEKYRSLTSTYYKNSNGVIFVYDITNKKSFDDLNYWVKDVIDNVNNNPKFLLIGNKIDLVQDRVIQIEQGEKFAKDNGMKFMECSALSNEGYCVNQAFEILIQEILEQDVNLTRPEQDNESEINSLIENRKDRQNLDDKKCCNQYIIIQSK